MERSTQRFAAELSPCRIAGFACNQAFMLALFYVGANQASSWGRFYFERSDLFAVLVVAVPMLLLLRLVSRAMRDRLLSIPAILICGIACTAGAFIPDLESSGLLSAIVPKGLLTGIPFAILLVSWGRSFGTVSSKISVSEVFIATVIGSIGCLLLSLLPLGGDIVLNLLPLGSIAALVAGLAKHRQVASHTDNELSANVNDAQGLAATNKHATSTSAVRLEGAVAGETILLSAKITAGTALFGMAAGFMETFNTEPGLAVMSTYPISFILLAAFALGTISLLLSDEFERSAALNKTYRLAIFITMAGYLLIPLPSFTSPFVSGETVVLGGYLGLETVLISLFLVMASIMRVDAASSMATGFCALFAGELVGVAIANAVNFTQSDVSTPYEVVVFAGLLVLFSYVFLFTERDFESLSEIVTTSDSFEEACTAIAVEYALSARETEILPFALRGRTSDRIAQELSISKSTVDTHLRRIYSKTGVHSRQELIDLCEAKRNA